MRAGWPAAAEDAVQETLIAIHTRRATYDPDLPFTAWVYGIARYKLVDEYRRHKRPATVPLDEAGELFGHDEAEAAIARRDVEQAAGQTAARQARSWCERSSWTAIPSRTPPRAPACRNRRSKSRCIAP